MIHKNCFGTIFLVWLICAPLAYLFLVYIPWTAVSYFLASVCMFMMGFVLFFFRVPKRERNGKDNEVTSVADGKVVIIDEVFESEFFKGQCLQISVYMDFYNVHVNYWPLDGEVTYYKYHPGKYLLAYLPKASELNEHTSIGMKTQFGDIFFKQIAGTFARRIVFNSKPGDRGTKSEECGIIKFGSRIDMYLPLGTEVKVELGQYVRACETVLAELHN